MQFKGIQVPFELVPFSEMNKKQAKQYFEWFIDTIDERLDILQEYITSTGGDFVLDKTPESLIPLWEWFVDKIEMIPKSDEEINNELEALPERFRGVIKVDDSKFSDETFLLSYNISVYFGEVLIKNHFQTSWGYLTSPKKLHGVNAPQIMGFAGGISDYAYGRIEVCMRKTLREKDKMKLYNTYKICESML